MQTSLSSSPAMASGFSMPQRPKRRCTGRKHLRRFTQMGYLLDWESFRKKLKTELRVTFSGPIWCVACNSSKVPIVSAVTNCPSISKDAPVRRFRCNLKHKEQQEMPKLCQAPRNVFNVESVSPVWDKSMFAFRTRSSSSRRSSCINRLISGRTTRETAASHSNTPLSFTYKSKVAWWYFNPFHTSCFKLSSSSSAMANVIDG